MMKMITKYATITSKHTREALVLMDNKVNDSLPQDFAHEHIYIYIYISLSQQILICKNKLVSVCKNNVVV